jgi:hypothetical protein
MIYYIVSNNKNLSYMDCGNFYVKTRMFTFKAQPNFFLYTPQMHMWADKL